jgi:hypothetical protein
MFISLLCVISNARLCKVYACDCGVISIVCQIKTYFLSCLFGYRDIKLV